MSDYCISAVICQKLLNLEKLPSERSTILKGRVNLTSSSVKIDWQLRVMCNSLFSNFSLEIYQVEAVSQEIERRNQERKMPEKSKYTQTVLLSYPVKCTELSSLPVSWVKHL